MSRTFGVEAEPEDVSAFIRHYIDLNSRNAEQGLPRYPVCVWGQRGIGKTDIVKQLAEQGVVDKVIDLPIAQIEEMGDFHGLPVTTEQDGRVVTVTAPPSWVPPEGDKRKIILLIDDFNRADIRIIRGIMQLLQNHAMITWSLPNQCTIVLTANPEEDDYIVTTLDRAMLTRMHHITLKTEFRAWLRWAEAHKVDGRVIGFIARYHEQLAPGGGRTCPRAWAMFGHGIRQIAQIKGDINTVRMHGLSVLDPEAVDTFIKFAEGDLEMIVDPEKICEDYPGVREDVLKPIKAKRSDIFNVIIERLIAYVAAMNSINIGSKAHTHVIQLLEEDTVPKEMKHLACREFAKGPMKGKLVSEKLAIQLGRVVGKKTT